MKRAIFIIFYILFWAMLWFVVPNTTIVIGLLPFAFIILLGVLFYEKTDRDAVPLGDFPREDSLFEELYRDGKL